MSLAEKIEKLEKEIAELNKRLEKLEETKIVKPKAITKQ